MNSRQSIVVGALLGPEGEGPIAVGFELARRLAARADLVHVMPGPEALAGGIGGEWAGVAAFEDLRQQCKTSLEEMVLRLAEQGPVQGSVCVEHGPPHRVLAGAAEQHSAVLLVVGAHRGALGGGPLLGSTAERVARKVECPVLVVRDPQRLPPRRVLVPVDLSPACGASLEHGMRLVRRWCAHEEVDVEAVFVLSDLQRELGLQFDAEQMARFARQELDRFAAEHLWHDGRRVARRVLLGDPVEQLLAELARQPADLVVMGTHGRSGFERWMMGSVAARMLRSAATNVLVVPPAKESADEARADATWSTGTDCFYFG